jgi:hypothetical protein
VSAARRLLRLLLLVAAAVVLLEGVERVVRYSVERHLEAEASWIWDPEWPRHPARAHAFQAVAELTLERVSPDARLLVAADEEYLVHVGEVWVGAGRATGEAAWDAYAVGPLMRPGPNQVTVVLRSARGVGGLLLCLELEPGGGCALRSDASWRVLGEYLAPGSALREDGRPPLVWGLAHVGRWEAPRATRRRPLMRDCVDLERGLEMMTVVDRGHEEMRRDDGSLVEVKAQRVRWRYTMAGFVSLDLLQPEQRRLALLTPIPRAGAAWPDDPRLVLITQPGQATWGPAEAQVLRSLDVLGDVEIAGARVHPLVEGCDELLASVPLEPEGLLGRRPPRESPVEHELRTVP